VPHSESVLLELGVESGDGLVSTGLGACGNLLLLEFVELLGVDLSLFLEFGNDAGLAPAGESSEVAEGAERSERLQSEHLEGLRHDHALLVVIGEGDSLEDLQATESGGAFGALVGSHASDDLPKDAGGSFPVLEALAGVRVNGSRHSKLSAELVAEERSRNVDRFAAHYNDTLAPEQLLGDNAGQAAEQMAASVDDNLLFEHA